MFTEIQSDIEGVFASDDWVARSIQTYPYGNEVASNDEHVVVNIVLGDATNYYESDRVSGRAHVQIFTPSGRGATRGYEIADYLDEVLKNRVLTNGTQTFASTVQTIGNLPDNPALFLMTYSVPVQYFNES